MSLALLNRQPITWDSEAASYITSVESADSQSLEPAVSRAINQFVIDCKIRGIWGAIKSSCLLCGAKTLNGALVPLKGVAPTNNNFVSADYNRETGLKGNGSNNYLDSNRAATSDPSNNSHAAVWVSSPQNGGSVSAYIGQNGFSTGASSIGVNLGTLESFFSLKSGNGAASAFAGIGGTTNSTGFFGMSRNNTNAFNYRINSKTGSANIATTTVQSGNWEILGRGGASRVPTNGRLSFYSIGESLDLRLLEQCVNNLNLNLLYALRYNSSDGDVQNYLSRVEAVDNYPLENSVRLAIHDFVTGCKSDNTWNSIKASCIMMGARTLNGALVPLVGNSPSNFNFLNSDYNRKTGLTGNGSNKYLDTNRSQNADPKNNNHISVYVSILPTNATTTYSNYFGALGNTIYTVCYNYPFVSNAEAGSNRTSTTALLGVVNKSIGLKGMSRSSASEFLYRSNGITTTNSVASSATNPNNTSFHIFANNGTTTERSNATISFYSIGESLDLSLLDSRISSLASSISSSL